MPTSNFPYGAAGPGIMAGAVTTSIALPQTATKTIFTVANGPIFVEQIFGIVTTVIGSVANATKIQVIPTTTPVTPVDVCATADVNALAVGALYQLVTGFSTGAVITITSGVGPVASSTLMTRFQMRPGTISVNCAGSDGGTGRIAWYMLYRVYGVPPNVPVAQAVTVTPAIS